ncbi:MAG: TIGR02221 family CRISPR-associated protein [Deltaproteobacteria bacterium]|nr:TIGR02221 family CRISPR-associated protein [Deltaproteobacteria bacterium]
MGKVYLSFLGLGKKNSSKDNYEYEPAVYELNGRMSRETQFVQVAELELLGIRTFERIIIVATKKSYDTHFDNLRRQLGEGSPEQVLPIIISEDMSPEGQWKWFDRILTHIGPGDELTIDLTHGYRSVPIVFSAAINFLYKARDIRLKAVYYGAFDKKWELGYAPVVDMKDFYSINEWAEAVSRLVEDADARKLAAVSERTPEFQVAELNDPHLVGAFTDLTDAIRNVDINRIETKANAAMKLIENRRQSASATGGLLLDLVVDKFASLSSAGPPSGLYDLSYFTLQLKIIQMLLDHKLYMQAYTVMREFMGSIGMIGVKKARVNSSDGRGRRKMFADVFVNMLQFEESKWHFDGRADEAKTKLMPFYERLKETGVAAALRAFANDLAAYRNGFDHAWTTKSGVFPDTATKGAYFLDELKKTVGILLETGILEKS